MASTTAQPSATDLLAQLQAVADQNGNIFCMQGSTPVMIPVAALFAKIAASGGLSTDALAKSDSLNLLGQVASFADLRALKPTTDGMRVSLKGWNAGSRFGGGEFIGRTTKATDDGGTVASGASWSWTRVIEDPCTLDITHFGALPDGKTDCAAAVQAMFKWSQANAQQVGIRFPAGKFYLSQFKYDTQIAYFRFTGRDSHFGYFATTTIVSDGATNYLLDVNARWVELAGIIFDGGNKGTTTPNTKGFFNNQIIEGQYFNGHSLCFKYVGGNCLQLKDTLDTKINQWYASYCTGDVIAAGFSNSPKGNWDHSTAIELSNFNVQNHRTGKVFNLPRATQSFITNGWIEHSDYPGDLSNGQWVINGFSMEDCKNPMRGNFSRIINLQQNLQSGSSWDFSETVTDITRWLSLWERGRIEIQNYGVFIDGTLDVMAYASRCKLNNNAASAQWFCLGKFYSPQTGDSIDINMVGCGNNLTVGDKLDKLDDVRQGGGNTLIRVHLTKAGANASHTPCGSSPLQGVRYVASGNNSVTVYVQLKPYTYNIIPMVTFTGKTHFEAGVSLYWLPDLSAVADADMGKVTGAVDSKENWSIGQKAGVGGSDDGYLLLKSKVVNGTLQVKVEGTIYSIALTKV